MKRQTMKMRKTWALGFLGFMASMAVPGLKEGDYTAALWLLWLLWFIHFIPVRKNR